MLFRSDETGPGSGQPAQFSTLIPRCPRNTCFSYLHNTLETLPSTIHKTVEYMGRWGANAFVPCAQFTKDEMWSQAAKVGSGRERGQGCKECGLSVPGPRVQSLDGELERDQRCLVAKREKGV